MSIIVISSKTRTDRKVYADDGFDYINDWIGYGCYTGNTKLSFSEWRSIALFKENVEARYITAGEKYECQFNKMDGIVYTFRMKADLFKIASKLDLFVE